MNKPRNVAKSEENPNEMHIAQEMSGEIILNVLQKAKGQINHTDVELADGGVEPPVPLNGMKWKDINNLLKMDEYKSLVA